GHLGLRPGRLQDTGLDLVRCHLDLTPARPPTDAPADPVGFLQPADGLRRLRWRDGAVRQRDLTAGPEERLVAPESPSDAAETVGDLVPLRGGHMTPFHRAGKAAPDRFQALKDGLHLGMSLPTLADGDLFEQGGDRTQLVGGL